jgi:hypothetical protein
LLAADGQRFAAEVVAEKGVKANASVGVVKFDERHGFDRFDDEADFFEDFARGALGGGFAGFDLAAGKLPEIGERGI